LTWGERIGNNKRAFPFVEEIPGFMVRFLHLSLLLHFFIVANAQTDTAHGKQAQVNVFVTNMAGKPTKGEQIQFRGNHSSKIYSGHSDANGRLSLQLPIGDSYTVTVRSISDSTKYGVVNIPALGPDEEYTEPFKVNVKFEPARKYTLDNVHFDFGKATLRPESFPQLEDLVGYLKYKTDIRVEIAGHTDNVGKEADNLKLSQQRAETIRNYVIKKGIEPARVVAKGYGASVPVADNDTEEGRQLNRRTEVRIL
jgi:outer membrane protein OmpA-like peptidoglycan-associated protein